MQRIKYKKTRKVDPNLYEYTGTHRTHEISTQLFVYNEDGFEEYTNIPLEKLRTELEDPAQANDVKWYNIHGLHDVEFIKAVGDLLKVERHIVGDILNVTRRARIEEQEDYLFFSIKSILQKENSDELQVEQISFVMKDNILVSFQEKRSDFFTHIRERIRTRTGVVRKKKEDYLLYLLLDSVMDNFYITLETYEDLVERLISETKADPQQEVYEKIEKNRGNLNFMKRSILPLRDALYNLKSIREDAAYDNIEKANYTFYSRLHQKSYELLDQIEYDINQMEAVANIFFSLQNQRMNQIMKTLTIVSVIFIPLTFIVGVYGMNFDNMPELRSANGYYVVWSVMLLTTALMIFYFKRKKWF